VNNNSLKVYLENDRKSSICCKGIGIEKYWHIKISVHKRGVENVYWQVKRAYISYQRTFIMGKTSNVLVYEKSRVGKSTLIKEASLLRVFLREIWH